MFHALRKCTAGACGSSGCELHEEMFTYEATRNKKRPWEHASRSDDFH